MSIEDKATLTIQEVVTITLPGFKPIPDMKKVSEWNGMWELRSPNNLCAIVRSEKSGFDAVFASLFDKPGALEARVIAIAHDLLVPIEVSNT